MHIYFSGIGGGAIGPLALLAKQAGYEVSGSDALASKYTDSLQHSGIRLHIGQTTQQIAAEHAAHPIDWLVHSSAIQPDHAELVFAQQHGIKHTKRDELLNKIITDHKLKLIAIAGTHGKSTTTAMMVWLLQALGVPISHSMGAKTSFAPMGEFTPGSEYFVYECDEFDRNFLAFHPHQALITGIAWDHHEIFPTQASYDQAFRDFMAQSHYLVLWQADVSRLQLTPNERTVVVSETGPAMTHITLPGIVNRQDAWQVVQAAHQLFGTPTDQLVAHMNNFPGLQQRMERLAPNLYTDYAHTPEKIRGGLNTAKEIATAAGKQLVVVYEPLTNRRQHYILDEYKDSFADAAKVYWLPTYLAREDPAQRVLTPAELVAHLANPSIAVPAQKDDELLRTLHQHVQNGAIVVGVGPSGGGSLDEWLRKHIKEIAA